MGRLNTERQNFEHDLNVVNDALINERLARVAAENKIVIKRRKFAAERRKNRLLMIDAEDAEVCHAQELFVIREDHRRAIGVATDALVAKRHRCHQDNTDFEVFLAEKDAEQLPL